MSIINKIAYRQSVLLPYFPPMLHRISDLLFRTFREKALGTYSEPSDRSPKETQALAAEEMDPNKECTHTLTKIQQLFLECPEAAQFWEEVKAKGPFSVQCVPYKETRGFGAKVNIDERLIMLSRLASYHMGPRLLFELWNLNQADRFFALSQNMCSLSPADFATKVEEVEYRSARNADQIVNQCVASGKWPINWQYWGNVFTDSKNDEEDFHEYLETQKANQHFQVYEKTWSHQCDKTKKSDI